MSVWHTVWGHLGAPVVTVTLRSGVRMWVTWMGLYCAGLLALAFLLR